MLRSAGFVSGHQFLALFHAAATRARVGAAHRHQTPHRFQRKADPELFAERSQSSRLPAARHRRNRTRCRTEAPGRQAARAQPRAAPPQEPSPLRSPDRGQSSEKGEGTYWQGREHARAPRRALRPAGPACCTWGNTRRSPVSLILTPGPPQRAEKRGDQRVCISPATGANTRRHLFPQQVCGVGLPANFKGFPGLGKLPWGSLFLPPLSN